MAPAAIALVRDGFAAAWPQRERLAEAFLARLLAAEPDFRRVLREPGRVGPRLVRALALLVHGLDRLYVYAPALEALALRLAELGIGESHYRSVEEALVATAAAAQGERFTAEAERAWRAACGEVAATMAAALRGAIPLAA